MAVKVLIKRKIKDGNMQAAARLLINSRKGAMTQPGYISSETLLSLDDPAKVTVVSMWQKKEDWQSWKNSAAREEIQAEFESYLSEPVEYEHYALGLPME